MKKILLFADWYEPGYKAGGPIRSCVNFARYMRDDYQVFVFTSDRDLGSPSPYEQVQVDQWLTDRPTEPQTDRPTESQRDQQRQSQRDQQRQSQTDQQRQSQRDQQRQLQTDKGNFAIYYCSPEMLTWQNIRRQIDGIRPDFIYLNSMFSTKFTIYPLLISRLYKRDLSLVLSPRGMLRESAIRFKTGKKKIFLNAFRILGLHRAIRFHATDKTEAEDIHKYFGPSSLVSMVPNFPGVVAYDLPVPVKNAGELSLIFIGRIHPIKNLDYLLEVLKQVGTAVRLTIVGSLEDAGYWDKCSRIISSLPPAIRVEYAGEIANQELQAITAKHHIFVLPTSGENFGHAIFEALALGKPVLISDQTPWRDLQAAGAGWDLPLDRPDLFSAAIDEAGALPQEAYEQRCHTTRQYITDYIARLNLKEAYQKLFS